MKSLFDKTKVIDRILGLDLYPINGPKCHLKLVLNSASLAGYLPRKVLHINEGLPKAERLSAAQIRTAKIGLADFIHRQRVPTATTPACSCGWPRQTVKHRNIFCPLYNLRCRGFVGPPAS